MTFLIDSDLSTHQTEAATLPDSTLPELTALPSPTQIVASASQDLSQAMPHPEQSLTQIISESCSPQSALLRLTIALGEAFQADRCMIALQGSQRSRLQPTYWSNDSTASFSSQLVWLLAHPVIQPALSHTDLLAIPDLQLEEANGFGIRSLLVVKTQFQGRNNGIVVLTRTHPYSWTEFEMQRLKTMSEAVAIAISQAQLQEQMHQQSQYQELLDQLTEAIRAAWDLDQIFQLAVEGAVSALQASRGLVLLLKYTNPLLKSRALERVPLAKVSVACEVSLEPSGQTNRQSAALDLIDKTETPPFWLSECQLCQQVFVGKTEPLVISGFTQSPASALENYVVDPEADVAAVFDLSRLPALLLIPLSHQDTVLGYLALQYHQPCCWQLEELAFAKLVATQISTAIIQARMLRQISTLVNERTEQLQRSLDVQAKLYEKTRQQIEQLRHLNQLKDEFLSTMSHELLTPLTSMTLAIRMLRQAELSPERRTRYLDILEQQCTQETNLINDLLALQKLSSRSASQQTQKLDIKHLIQDLVRTFEEDWAKKELALSVDLPDRPLTVHTDADSLNRILAELLANAGKYALPGSTIHLKAVPAVNQHNSRVVLTLSNVGAAIDPEELPHIFDKFRRGRGVTQQAVPGTGLGLALVKGLTEQLNGTIVASSYPLAQDGVWETCFTLSLPQFPQSVVDAESLP